jgi:hypothetical protein
MPPPLSAAEQAALAVIARRWLASPTASDSVEGIGRFWLGDPVFGALHAARVLALLQAQGFVQAHTAADGRIAWWRNPQHSDNELLRWLDEVQL